MHWRKLSLFNISLALYATGIFRIGVTTKHNGNIHTVTQMSTTVMQKRFDDCYDRDVVHFIPI